MQNMHVLWKEERRRFCKTEPMWEYCLPDLDKKARKAILKSNKLDAYLRAVREAL